jgi:peptide/nickel transport system permease protein
VFAVRLRWLPSLGYSGLKAMILPTVTLAFGLLAAILRVTRASFLESLRADYVRTARSKGASQQRVILRHVLPNAVMPIVTIVGLQFGNLLGGIVAIEMVFNWPGIGFLMIRAVQQRDFPLVQAIIVVISTTFVLINFLVDLLYALVDPRIRENVR